MIRKKHLPSIALGFVVGTLGYWTADFSEDGEFARVIYFYLGPGAFICAVIAFSLLKRSPGFIALMVSLGVFLGMLSKIFYDILRDSSSHDMLPFELLLGLVIVLPAAFFGSFLVWGIFKIAGKD
ncbi:hypothetical protein SAMN03080617_00233 [Algoriphagus alkaliphilus]|uniref:Uncharacterized protein n=1 Tax=Algoriphagus alkaliphilus TaxID=279824 RepID=A0A1G5UZW9_9BACT|nr:hypothetical protein [Algoriphagus alkaliphilus]MBA4300672.1 hypothetical protein [Cyclobacterium sp.]SDA39169.1 hypothetical protein SAMN03080617_00233 [Algoriphagus alkaliphilus]